MLLMHAASALLVNARDGAALGPPVYVALVADILGPAAICAVNKKLASSMSWRHSCVGERCREGEVGGMCWKAVSY
jgi:hypothetical protein